MIDCDRDVDMQLEKKMREAKQIFLSYNCSKYTMWRENPKQYELYDKLKIGIEVENKWREEQLENYFQEITTKSANTKLWIQFNEMYELVAEIRNEKSIMIMDDVLNVIYEKLNAKDKVIIAETIIGRKARECRSGLIYISYDLGNQMQAALFAKYSFDLLNDAMQQNNQKERVNKAVTMCNTIVGELSLEKFL
jgi:hypothetical protein